MNCPKCDSDTKVYDSRGGAWCIRRKRECLNCKRRFNTIEIKSKDYVELIKNQKSNDEEEFEWL